MSLNIHGFVIRYKIVSKSVTYKRLLAVSNIFRDKEVLAQYIKNVENALGKVWFIFAQKMYFPWKKKFEWFLN